jgi:hypothetical protein
MAKLYTIVSAENKQLHNFRTCVDFTHGDSGPYDCELRKSVLPKGPTSRGPTFQSQRRVATTRRHAHSAKDLHTPPALLTTPNAAHTTRASLHTPTHLHHSTSRRCRHAPRSAHTLRAAPHCTLHNASPCNASRCCVRTLHKRTQLCKPSIHSFAFVYVCVTVCRRSRPRHRRERQPRQRRRRKRRRLRPRPRMTLLRPRMMR